MQTSEPFYLHTLRESLSGRQRKNSSYSLRAFAKDLEIDSSNLSAILQRKRGLPVVRAKKFAQKLKLSAKEAALFVSSTLKTQTRLDAIQVQEEAKQYLLDDKYFKVIAEWEYYAFLQFMETKDFKPDFDFIALRLGSSKTRVIQVVDNLFLLGFIKKDLNKGFVRTVPSLETTEDIESQALQAAHIENFTLAKEKLESTPVEFRDFSSVTMAIDPDKLPEAKAIIREFQEKLHALLTKSSKTEVYQFNCQLFPLTKNRGNQ